MTGIESRMLGRGCAGGEGGAGTVCSADEDRHFVEGLAYAAGVEGVLVDHGGIHALGEGHHSAASAALFGRVDRVV